MQEAIFTTITPGTEPGSATRAPDPHQAPPVSAATRRNLFGAMGAALLLTAAEAGPGKAVELDGPLLDAYRRWLPWEAKRIEVRKLDSDIPDAEYDAIFDAYTGPWHETTREMMELEARTPEGIQTKARVLRSLLENHVGFGASTPPISSNTTEEFAWSLVKDVLGRTGV